MVNGVCRNLNERRLRPVESIGCLWPLRPRATLHEKWPCCCNEYDHLRSGLPWKTVVTLQCQPLHPHKWAQWEAGVCIYSLQTCCCVFWTQAQLWWMERLWKYVLWSDHISVCFGKFNMLYELRIRKDTQAVNSRCKSCIYNIICDDIEVAWVVCICVDKMHILKFSKGHMLSKRFLIPGVPYTSFSWH